MKYNFIMQIMRRYVWARLITFVFFSCFFIWTFIPLHVTRRVTKIEWKDILAINLQNVNGKDAQLNNLASLLEKPDPLTDFLPQSIQLSIPELVWYGSRGKIRVSITGGKEGREKSPRMPEMGTLNSFATQNYLLIEADLDLSNMDITPAAQIQQPWTDDGNITFTWDINATKAGEKDGLIWIYGYLPDDVRNQEKRLILSAQHFTITVRRIFGLGISSLRWVGGGGILVSLLSLLDTWSHNNNKINKSSSRLQ